MIDRSLNGVAAGDGQDQPLFRLQLGRSYRLHMHNMTRFPHPMHVHGQPFRVLSRNGVPEPQQPWRDTVLLDADDHVNLLLRASNPGRWMMHCHIPEHMQSGMSTTVEIA